MNKRKKTTPKNLSNRQKVKEQAKKIKRLQAEREEYRHTAMLYKDIAFALDGAIRDLKVKNEALKEKLGTKQPFWRRMLG
ncbi:hypothetical protein PBV87_00730 [Niameybacter massiliensis]|uniref:Uncharacterized protein n=1 Tax=Holtiella tumoricola TaxID=3018743 RepID=A0AA42IYH5_9FIRM|nr:MULTISPECIES: hypothetical protein [Lachnospirales]MDA3730037.1 hypothetical protein [Holtiella tumoricola]